MRVAFCASCGAPLDAPWTEIVVVCRYCGAHDLPGAEGDPVPPVAPDDGRPRLHVGGRTYVLEGRIGQGDATDVFRARWAMRLGELVVVKVLRALPDADLVRREWAALERLHARDDAGAAHFAGLLPQPIATGPMRGDRDRLVSVFQWRSGFVHTLEHARAAHPWGVDGRVVVWIFKRLLELLEWTHRSGTVHGAVLPPHVLVHPRDHGATLIGWSAATPAGERIPAVSRAWSAFYPDAARGGRVATPATDVAMAARCALWVGGAGTGPLGLRAVPAPLYALLDDVAKGGSPDAGAVRARLDVVSREVYGPPSYNPLPMPGWATPPAGR